MTTSPASTVSPADTTGIPRMASTEVIIPSSDATTLKMPSVSVSTVSGGLLRSMTSTQAYVPFMFTDMEDIPSKDKRKAVSVFFTSSDGIKVPTESEFSSSFFMITSASMSLFPVICISQTTSEEANISTSPASVPTISPRRLRYLYATKGNPTAFSTVRSIPSSAAAR